MTKFVLQGFVLELEKHGFVLPVLRTGAKMLWKGIAGGTKAGVKVGKKLTTTNVDGVTRFSFPKALTAGFAGLEIPGIVKQTRQYTEKAPYYTRGVM
jgi:hypothetical protein